MTLYDFAITTYIKNLSNMDKILEKAEMFAKEKKVSDDVILNSRLAIDQFPFVRQVQSISDVAKASGAVLADIQPPVFEDTEKTLAELRARVMKTIDFLKTITPNMVDEAKLAERKVALRWLPGKGLTAYDNVTVYSLPNFFFHYTTAYSILRHLGMQIGKTDYMGGLPFVDVN